MLGPDGENTASVYLIKKGYTIIERNFRSPFGEIDIIAKKNSFIIFIEVKTSKSSVFGYPEDRIDSGKLKRIKKTAGHFLRHNIQEGENYSFRFDLIAIIKTRKGCNIEHYKDIIIA